MSMSHDARHLIASETVTQLMAWFDSGKPSDEHQVDGRCTFDEHGYETLLAVIPEYGVLRLRVDFVPAAEVNDTLGKGMGIIAVKIPTDASELTEEDN